MASSRRAASAWRKSVGLAAIAAVALLVGLASAAPQPQYTPPAAAPGAAAAATPAAGQQNQCGQVRTRRALQSLTPADRNAFIQGVLKLKQTGVIDGLARRHRAGMQWHGTPLFMPMHRALMKEFEDSLLKVAPTLSGVPYWDELQDGSNRGIQSSAIFSNTLMGPLANGPLQGPFKGFKDDKGAPVTRAPLQASSGFSWLPSSQVMTAVLQRMKTFNNFSSIVEVSPHNQFHVLVGGTMGDVAVSPADPLFWTHHAYIDLLWALWQSLTPGNVDRLDAPFQGKSSIPLDAPVVLYEKMYTNRDMTRYRTRLCYQYIVPTTTAPKSKRSPNPEPKPEPQPQPGYHHNYNKCARPKPQPHFTNVQELPAEAVAKVMPMKPLAEVRACEAYVNGVITELNTKIANHEVDPAKLPCVMTLFAELNAGAPPADDFQQSLVFNASAQAVPPPPPTATQPADYGYYNAPATTAAVDAAPTSTAAFEQAAGAAAAPTVAVAPPTSQYAYSSAKMRAAVASGAAASHAVAGSPLVAVAAVAAALFAAAAL